MTGRKSSEGVMRKQRLKFIGSLRSLPFLSVIVAGLVFSGPSFGAGMSDDEIRMKFEAMEKRMQNLEKRVQEKDKEIEDLKKEKEVLSKEIKALKEGRKEQDKETGIIK
jgi:peptidoglycan hydrolase CwlO-like protein